MAIEQNNRPSDETPGSQDEARLADAATPKFLSLIDGKLRPTLKSPSGRLIKIIGNLEDFPPQEETK